MRDRFSAPYPQLTPGSPGQTELSQARVWWGQQWQTNRKTDTGSELSGHLGTPLSASPPGSSPGALAELGVWRSCLWLRACGEVLSAPITCTSHSPRKKPSEERQRPRDRGEKSQVFTQLHGVFMAKRTFSSFEYWGISFLLNTSILDPISETGPKP